MSSSDLGWALDSRKPNYSALDASTAAASSPVKVSLKLVVKLLSHALTVGLAIARQQS